jgi:hypothetical protein
MIILKKCAGERGLRCNVENSGARSKGTDKHREHRETQRATEKRASLGER